MFFYSEPSQVVVIPLSLLFSTSSLSFSNTTIGTSSQVSLTVSSSGNAVETISLSDNSDQFTFSPSSFVLTGGLTTQAVTVTFTPTSSGLKTGSLTLSSSGGDIELISFSGTGRDTYYSNISYQLSISGNNAVDLSSNSSPVTFFGNAQVSTVETKFGGGSIKLDGDGDYVALPSGSQFNFGTDSFTIETWFYISGNSLLSPGNVRYGTLFASYATGGTNTGYQLMVAGNSTTTGTGLEFTQVTNNSAVASISYYATIQKNVWNHVAISRDAANNGRTMRMYLNGTLVATSNSWAGINVQGTGYIPKIGATLYANYPYYLNGYIEELRVTKGVSRYASNFTPGQI